MGGISIKTHRVYISRLNTKKPAIAKDIDTAKAVLDLSKQIYQNEEDRVKSIDTKIYYLFTISGVLLAAMSFIIGQTNTTTTPWFKLFSFISNILIVFFIIISILLSVFGLFARKFSCIEISEFSSPEFMMCESFEAIYKLIVTFEDAINKNKVVIKIKVLLFNLACVSIILCFSVIGLKFILKLILEFLVNVK